MMTYRQLKMKIIVTKMNLYWLNDKDDCILYNLQNKFKNLKKLVLNQDIFYSKNEILEIKENNNCNVNKITLNKIVGNNIRFIIIYTKFIKNNNVYIFFTIYLLNIPHILYINYLFLF